MTAMFSRTVRPFRLAITALVVPLRAAVAGAQQQAANQQQEIEVARPTSRRPRRRPRRSHAAATAVPRSGRCG